MRMTYLYKNRTQKKFIKSLKMQNPQLSIPINYYESRIRYQQ